MQHLTKTTKPKCLAARESMYHLIRQSRFMSRRNPPQRRFTRTPKPATSTGANILVADEQETSQTFQGDFFGSDYLAEDFPGFDGDIGQNERDEALNAGERGEDSDDEDYDNNGKGSLTPELETTFEQPREPLQVPNDGAEDHIEPLPSKTSSFHSLPAHQEGIHAKLFGGKAGVPVEVTSNTLTTTFFYNSEDGFQHYKSSIEGIEENEYAPFASHMDWEVARWAKMHGTGSTAFSDLLAIDGVPEALGLSYLNSMELNNIIDRRLPAQRPSFSRREVVIAGKTVDIYHRPVLDCIKEFYSTPKHAPYLVNTGKWWWSTQKQLEGDKPGATIIPVILSSDKTQITLVRNKTAYPVYLTIGNLPKGIRRKPSKQGQILVAYLPTTQLKHMVTKASRRRAVANLFHACVGSLLAPLREAGVNGIILASGDGVKRRCHPILAAYVADYPKQILVTCSYYGDCPLCLAEKKNLGQYPPTADFCDPAQAIHATQLVGKAEWSQACLDANIKPIQHLSYCCSGLQISGVRVIFALPGKLFSRLFAPGTKPTGHLAYVEWFTKFSVYPELNLGLYRVKPLLRRDGSQAFSVLPVETIQQSANLYPNSLGSFVVVLRFGFHDWSSGLCIEVVDFLRILVFPVLYQFSSVPAV
ncbi:hypothetical protein PM082_024827 [Marasmius tenuissimus]|nr:hypothetical protein PM082_024827 [Marasmius tenuissimus]